MVMIRTASVAVALAASLALATEASAQVQFASAAGAEEVTYSENVASIIQQNCVVCHRPGGIGPMSLLTYEDARRYAQRIRAQVSAREMPPYAYDSDVGIQDLQEDWRLADERSEEHTSELQS